jgi:hypothetical protein
MAASSLQHRSEKLKKRREGNLAASPAAGTSSTAGAQQNPQHDKKSPQATGKGQRWQTFNTFMDVIAPRLTLAERTVWIVMFRHARFGTCDISERAIATQANIDKVTAGKALRQLVELKLVWAVFRSTDKQKSSRYGIRPCPDERLSAVIRLHETRTATAHARRQRNGGDRRGRRRQPSTG